MRDGLRTRVRRTTQIAWDGPLLARSHTQISGEPATARGASPTLRRCHIVHIPTCSVVARRRGLFYSDSLFTFPQFFIYASVTPLFYQSLFLFPFLFEGIYTNILPGPKNYNPLNGEQSRCLFVDMSFYQGSYKTFSIFKTDKALILNKLTRTKQIKIHYKFKVYKKLCTVCSDIRKTLTPYLGVKTSFAKFHTLSLS